MSALCKIFQFVLNIFEQVLNVVVTALKMVADAAVDVLSEIVSAAGQALGISGNTFLWIGLGFGLWFFMKREGNKGGVNRLEISSSEKKDRTSGYTGSGG